MSQRHVLHPKNWRGQNVNKLLGKKNAVSENCSTLVGVESGEIKG